MKNKNTVLMVVLNNVLSDSRVKREANALSELDYDVKILGLKKTDKDVVNSIYNRKIQVSLIQLFSKNILPNNSFGWIFKYFEFLIKCILKTVFINPDIIHSHDLDALLPGYLASKITKAKLIYDSHELFTETSDLRKKRISQIWKIIERLLIKRVDCVIAANESRSTIMYKEYGALSKPNVILNIPNKEIQLDQNSKKIDILENNTIKKMKIVLYQGKMDSARNIEKLILSVKYWNDNLILLLIGSISLDYKQELDKIISSNSISEKVLFHEPVNSDILLNYTSKAHIGIVIYKNTSRNNYYCAPNKLFEYASVGKPIAGCNFPEVKKVITSYQIGELFDPENPESIAHSVNMISSNYSKYSNPNNFQKLFRVVNWDIQKDNLKKIYNNL